MDLHVDGHRGRFEFQMEGQRTGEQEGNPPSQPSAPGFVFRVHCKDNYPCRIQDSETPLSSGSFVSKTVPIPVEQPEFAQAALGAKRWRIVPRGTFSRGRRTRLRIWSRKRYRFESVPRQTPFLQHSVLTSYALSRGRIDQLDRSVKGIRLF
jgi:hypothetical protein